MHSLNAAWNHLQSAIKKEIDGFEDAATGKETALVETKWNLQ
jgi:hypothetical protein